MAVEFISHNVKQKQAKSLISDTQSSIFIDEFEEQKGRKVYIRPGRFYQPPRSVFLVFKARRLSYHFRYVDFRLKLTVVPVVQI